MQKLEKPTNATPLNIIYNILRGQGSLIWVKSRMAGENIAE